MFSSGWIRHLTPALSPFASEANAEREKRRGAVTMLDLLPVEFVQMAKSVEPALACGKKKSVHNSSTI
jgi:hypothetical protein